MDRDRGVIAHVTDAVNVARWREAVHVSGSVRTGSRLDEASSLLVECEELLVLDALNDSEHAPRHVVVNRRHLSRPPDQRHDREASVGLGVERVAAVALRVTDPLLGGEHIGRREMAPHLSRDEPGGLPPVGVPVDDGADRAHQLVQARGRDRSAVAHHDSSPSSLDHEAAENSSPFTSPP
jgi:hypothetical protein